LVLNVKLAKKQEDFYMILVPDAESDLPHLKECNGLKNMEKRRVCNAMELTTMRSK
jgi:hypothetical protein